MIYKSPDLDESETNPRLVPRAHPLGVLLLEVVPDRLHLQRQWRSSQTHALESGFSLQTMSTSAALGMALTQRGCSELHRQLGQRALLSFAGAFRFS